MNTDNVRIPVKGWRRSRFCQGGECAEVTRLGDTIFLRGSADPATVVRLSAAEWQAFAQGVRSGEFHDLG
jgi:hypothetical protein